MRGAGALMSPVQRGVVLAGLGAARSRVAAFVAVTALGSTCAIASPLILAGIVQRPDRPATTVAAALAAYAVAVAAARFLYDVRMVLANAVEQRVATTADGTVLRSLLGADGSLAVANNPARIASVVASFHRSNKMLVQILLMAFLGGLFDVALSFLVIGGYVDWTIGAAVVGYGAASVWLTLRANKVTSAYLKRAQHNSDEASNLLGNVLTNLVSLRVFRGIDWVVAANDRYFRRSRQGWTDFYRRRVGFGALQGVLIVVQYVAVFGLLLWREGTAQLAQVVVLVMVLSQLNRPFELIATALREFAVARSMAAPLQDLLDAHAPVPRVGRARVPPDRAFDIVLDDVGYRYRSGAAPTVAGVRAAIEPGRLTFVVGPSGAGKSTLLGILLGTHPGYTVSVRVAGAELADLDLEDYWRLVGYVPQDPMMMNASLRDNVLFGRPGTDAEVLEALRAVELGGGWLAELDGGLDYRIGERGSLLSGGERQRLALARALIGAPRLLLLDEPSSALDEQTERSIFERLRAAGREMTIVAVTHRTGLVRDGDHVIHCGAPVAEPALPR